MKVSSEYIIDIWEFMENYYGIIYDGDFKLVHEEMCYYLRNKNFFVKKIGFKNVKKDQILCGEIVLVKDEEGKVVPYASPRRIEDLDLDEINSLKDKKSFIKPIENYDNLKDVGKKDYEFYLGLKSEIPSKKKRVRRRNYN